MGMRVSIVVLMTWTGVVAAQPLPRVPASGGNSTQTADGSSDGGGGASAPAGPSAEAEQVATRSDEVRRIAREVHELCAAVGDASGNVDAAKLRHVWVQGVLGDAELRVRFARDRLERDRLARDRSDLTLQAREGLRRIVDGEDGAGIPSELTSDFDQFVRVVRDSFELPRSLENGTARICALCRDSPRLCELRRPAAAAAAVVAAPDEVQSVVEEIEGTLDGQRLGGDGPLAAVAASVREAGDEAHSASLVGLAGSAVAERAAVGASALARLIADRARRESIGWFLQRVGEDICGGDAPSDAQKEIRAHWLSSLCELAEREELVGYGAGGALLASLREAVEADVRGWPGAASGLVLSGGLGMTDPLTCNGNEESRGCASVRDFRADVERLLGQLVDGGKATVVFAEIAAAIQRANPDGRSSPARVLACGLTVPASFEHSGEALEKALPTRRARVAAMLLVALADAPPCLGWLSARAREADDPTKSVRLELITRLHGAAYRSANQLRDAWGRLVDALALYRAELPQPTLTDLPELELPDEVNEDTDLSGAVRASRQLLDATVRVRLLPQTLERVRRVRALADAACDLALAVLGTLDQLAGTDAIQVDIAKAEVLLRRIDAALDAAGRMLDGDWVAALGGIRRLLGTVSPDLGARIGRGLTVIQTIVSIEDPDELAAALDDIADPVGGWRRKQQDGASVVSISAFPGLWGGVEARWGPYGAVIERGKPLYPVAPTLSFPLGLDFAWGMGGWSLGGFVSVLDPVAFLQYDVDAGGRLPGAQLLTVLAPGLGVRVGVADSPFTLAVMGVYRPSFRTEERQVAGSGADVLQIGVLLSVDVTLFELRVRQGGDP